MKRMQKKQAGFTILEIGIVMIILVSLVVAFSANLWEKQKASEFNLIKIWYTKSVPEAIATCRTKYGNNLQLIPVAGMAPALQTCGLAAETIYGIAWTADDVGVTGTGMPSVVINYPLTGMDDFAVEGPLLVGILSEEGGDIVEGAAFGTPDIQVEVRIR